MLILATCTYSAACLATWCTASPSCTSSTPAPAPIPRNSNSLLERARMPQEGLRAIRASLPQIAS